MWRVKAEPVGSLSPRPKTLAHGFWLRTVRRQGTVLRRRQPWCPPLLARWLLAQLIANGEAFGQYVPVPPINWVAGSLAVRQPFVEGARPLRTLTRREVVSPPVARALRLFWDGVAVCWRRTGRLPDVGGRIYQPWELYQPLRTDNVVLDRHGRCWLIDVGVSNVFHDRRSPFGRVHGTLMLRALRRAGASVLMTTDR